MKYQSVIFDLDGTLLNSLDDLHDSVNAMLKMMDKPPRALDEVRAFVGNGVVKLVTRALGGGASNAEIERGLALFQEDYSKKMENKTAPYPGVMEMLYALQRRNISCAVVSNKYDAAVKPLCEKYFGALVPVAIGEGDGVPKKPSPEGTQKAMALLGAKAEHTLYVGDSDVDVMTAHNAKLPCAGVTWGFRSREHLETAGADYIFDSVEELTQFILS